MAKHDRESKAGEQLDKNDMHRLAECTAPGWAVGITSELAEAFREDVEKIMKKGVEYILKPANILRVKNHE